MKFAYWWIPVRKISSKSAEWSWKYHIFPIFKMVIIHHKISIFLLPTGLGGLIYVTTPYFIKIDEKAKIDLPQVNLAPTALLGSWEHGSKQSELYERCSALLPLSLPAEFQLMSLHDWK